MFSNTNLAATDGVEIGTFGMMDTVCCKTDGHLVYADCVLLNAFISNESIRGQSSLRKFDRLLDLRSKKLINRDQI